MRTRNIQAQLTGRVTISLMSFWREVQTARGLTSLPERVSNHVVRVEEERVTPLTTHPDWPRASSPINDNYYVNVLKAGLLAMSRKTLKCVQLPETPKKQNRHSDTTVSKCKLFCCKSCTYCKRGFAKERCKSRCCKLLS